MERKLRSEVEASTHFLLCSCTNLEFLASSSAIWSDKQRTRGKKSEREDWEGNPGKERKREEIGELRDEPVRPAVILTMMQPVMANPTRKGQLRLNSLLKNTGHGSNVFISLAHSPFAADRNPSEPLLLGLGDRIFFWGNYIIADVCFSEKPLYINYLQTTPYPYFTI